MTREPKEREVYMKRKNIYTIQNNELKEEKKNTYIMTTQKSIITILFYMLTVLKINVGTLL